MMLIFSPFHTLSRLFNNCIELKGVEIKLTPPPPPYAQKKLPSKDPVLLGLKNSLQRRGTKD